jgi:hypothetical protein
MSNIPRPTVKQLRTEIEKLGITEQTAGMSIDELIRQARETDDPFAFVQKLPKASVETKAAPDETKTAPAETQAALDQAKPTLDEAKSSTSETDELSSPLPSLGSDADGDRVEELMKTRATPLPDGRVMVTTPNGNEEFANHMFQEKPPVSESPNDFQDVMNYTTQVASQASKIPAETFDGNEFLGKTLAGGLKILEPGLRCQEYCIGLPIGEVPMDQVRAGKYHVSRHLEAQINLDQAIALRKITLGLDAAGATLKSGKRIIKAADAVRWLLEQIPIE